MFVRLTPPDTLLQAELPKRPRMSLTIPKSPLLQTKTRRFSRVCVAKQQEYKAFVCFHHFFMLEKQN
jgi:hypothetical protein